MSALPIVLAALLGANPVKFQRHLIDNFPAGYQVAVADINGDGRPDVIALSTEADRVDWYENPGWQRHPVARTAKNIDLAVRDLDRNGRPVIALASEFYFDESSRGGEIQILRQPAKPDDLWTRAPIAVDPVVHRLRWGDLEGNGRPRAHPRPDLRPRLPRHASPEAGPPLGVSPAPPPRAAVGGLEDRRVAHRAARHPGGGPRRRRAGRDPHRKLRGHPPLRLQRTGAGGTLA